MKVFNKNSIIIMGILGLAILISISIFALSRDSKTIEDYLDLGAKYLQDQDYDSAISAFVQALEIDDKNVEAYLGLADAYVGVGENDKAIEILQEGYEKTGDERIGEKLDNLRQMSKYITLPMSDKVLELATLVKNIDVWTINGKNYSMPDFNKMTPESATVELGLKSWVDDPNHYIADRVEYIAGLDDHSIWVVKDYSEETGSLILENGRNTGECSVSYTLMFNNTQANLFYDIGGRFPFDSNANILFDYLEKNGLTSIESIYSFIIGDELEIDSTPKHIVLFPGSEEIYISPSDDDRTYIHIHPITGEPAVGNPLVGIGDNPDCNLEFVIYYGDAGKN